MTTALGVGLIGASSVAGAWNPLNGGGSACRISAGGIGCGAGGSMNRSTMTSLMTSTGTSLIISLMTSTGLSTNTSLMTSRSTVISLGGC
jgi:hypothetical protein